MKILLLEDDIACLESLERALKPTGFECKTFHNPVEALKEFKENSYDVVVTDIKMPVMNGIQVLKKVKKMNPETYVIILTGFADVNNAVEALNNDSYAFFRKPINLESFIQVITKIEMKLVEIKIQEMNHYHRTLEYENLKEKYRSLQRSIKEQGSENTGKT